jgi:protein FAM32A
LHFYYYFFYVEVVVAPSFREDATYYRQSAIGNRELLFGEHTDYIPVSEENFPPRTKLCVFRMKPAVVPGKLKFKSSGGGGGSSSSNVSKAAKGPPVAVPTGESVLKKRKIEEQQETEETEASHTAETKVHLTEAQKRFKQRQQEREKTEAKKYATSNFRDRVDEFNQKLSKLTEHNDIPRVSAAGNG